MVQDKFYNGWKSGHYIINIFIFGSNGMIIMPMVNCPDPIHNSELAAIGFLPFIPKFDIFYEQHRAKCTLNLAFGMLGKESIMKSLEKK